jgi:hypothetical protein
MRVVAAVLLVAAVAVGTSCGSGNDAAKGTTDDGVPGSDSGGATTTSGPTPACKSCYRAHGVSFDYPSNWRRGKDIVAPISHVWAVEVSPGGDDYAKVAKEPLGVYSDRPGPVTAKNLDAVQARFASSVRAEWKAFEGTVRGPERLTTASRPALRFQVTWARDGKRFESTEFLVFDGMTMYTLSCNHLRKKTELARGCAQILRTFKVPG